MLSSIGQNSRLLVPLLFMEKGLTEEKESRENSTLTFISEDKCGCLRSQIEPKGPGNTKSEIAHIN